MFHLALSDCSFPDGPPFGPKMNCLTESCADNIFLLICKYAKYHLGKASKHPPMFDN